MKIFVFFVIVLLAKIEFISSQKDCWMFDFNDSALFSDFTACTPNNAGNFGPMALKSYNASVEPAPYRSTSTYYLSATDTLYSTSCWQSQPFALAARTNITMEIAFQLNHNQYNPYTYIFIEFYARQSNGYLRYIYTRMYNIKTQNWSVDHVTFPVSKEVEDEDIVVSAITIIYFYP